jgi:branched-chain amino acid transport system ATP-binding protein
MNPVAELLRCEGVTVTFGGVIAVRDVTLGIGAGEILGIAGPNGAGKTTLFNAISGHVRLAAGRIEFGGQQIDHLPPHAIFQKGIARTFQVPEIIGSQDVYTNVLAGAHFARDDNLTGAMRFSAEAHLAATSAIREHALSARSTRIAAGLSLYEKKLTMLASAMAEGPQLLLLDEPVGGLSSRETDAFRDHIQGAASHGTTIVIIEHVVRFLMGVTDRLVILHRGEILFDGAPGAARDDADVRRLYLGSKFA